MIKIKICGITNMEDAKWGVNLGARFLGFNFYPQSPRKISVKNAKDIIAQLPPFVGSVGVFVDSAIEEIDSIIKKTHIQHVQLHGSESAAFVASIKEKGVSVIKAIRLKDASMIEDLRPYAESADFFLIDTFVDDMPGGTGQVGNWEAAGKIKLLFNKPIFLAGGLNPENVAAAVESVRPFGVDVCSGIERLPRRKDYEKMKEFILQAQGA